MHHSLLTQMAVNSTAVVPSRYASSSVGGERFIGSDDMGVQRCRLFVSGSALGSELGYSGIFMLHVFLRYTTTGSTSRIKGTVSAEPLAGAVLPGRLHDAQFNPHIRLLTRANASLTELSGMATFPFVSSAWAAAHAACTGLRGICMHGRMRSMQSVPPPAHAPSLLSLLLP